MVYQGSVTDGSPNNGNYIGITEHTFKWRLYQHLNSFKYRSKVNSTELSKHIWNLKDQGITNPCITWSILDHAKTCQNGMKRCNLCTAEKYHILWQSENILNKRDEMISKCRHENKFYLSKFKSVPPDKSSGWCHWIIMITLHSVMVYSVGNNWRLYSSDDRQSEWNLKLRE